MPAVEYVETKRCPVCRRKGAIFVPVDGYEAWLNGTLIQNAMPDVRPELREQLVTGTHPDCWESLFEGSEW